MTTPVEHPSSEQIVRQLADAGDPVLMSFSRGKDSLAAWLALDEAGVEVIPFHLYRIPGLRFVEDSLAMFEDFFGAEIIRLPHPALFRQLNELVFQPPERCAVIEAADLPTLDYDDLNNMLREDYELPTGWVADGVRAADSPMRRVALNRYGPMRPVGWRASVIWDYRADDVRAIIDRHDAPLAIDYVWFGRSFDGLDHRYMAPLAKHAPEDFERVRFWFPLVDLELYRVAELFERKGVPWMRTTKFSLRSKR